MVILFFVKWKKLSYLDSSFMLMFQLWFCTLLTFPRAYVKDTDFGARKLSYNQKWNGNYTLFNIFSRIHYILMTEVHIDHI